MRQLQFDVTSEELADVHLLNVRTSPELSRTKRNTRITTGAGIAIMGLMLVSFYVVQWTWGLAAGVVLGCAGVGFLVGLLYGPVYDSELKKRLLRQARASVAGATVVHVAMELRPNGLWTQQNGMEILLPWTDAVSVEDLAEGIFLRFRPGVALVRARAFADTAERKQFLDEARRLAASDRRV